MSANVENDPMLGANGYPHEDELDRIREWPWEQGFRGLMAYIRPRWEPYGSWQQDGDRFRLATGGWSGNEEIIAALQENQMFSMICPVSWHVGGLYIYDVQVWSDGPKGKRVLVRDPATPLDEHGFSVIGCDHIGSGEPRPETKEPRA